MWRATNTSTWLMSTRTDTSKSLDLGFCGVERVSKEDESLAIDLVRIHEDKTYSLCDAMSVVVVARLGIHRRYRLRPPLRRVRAIRPVVGIALRRGAPRSTTFSEQIAQPCRTCSRDFRARASIRRRSGRAISSNLLCTGPPDDSSFSNPNFYRKVPYSQHLQRSGITNADLASKRASGHSIRPRSDSDLKREVRRPRVVRCTRSGRQ
jgi:hypothetical protein